MTLDYYGRCVKCNKNERHLNKHRACSTCLKKRIVAKCEGCGIESMVSIYSNRKRCVKCAVHTRNKAKICVDCGDTFISSTPSQQRCSGCKIKRLTMTCIDCGKQRKAQCINIIKKVKRCKECSINHTLKKQNLFVFLETPQKTICISCGGYFLRISNRKTICDDCEYRRWGWNRPLKKKYQQYFERAKTLNISIRGMKPSQLKNAITEKEKESSVAISTTTSDKQAVVGGTTNG